MRKILFFITLSLAIVSCEKKYKFVLEVPDKVNTAQKLNLQIKEEHNLPFGKVTYFIDGKEIENPNQIDLSNFVLGKHVVKALVNYDNKEKEIVKTFYLFADKAPQVYHYKIVNVYPHDTGAYTQGLEYHKGFLYESTGKNGESSLRKVDLKTGKVVQKIDLPNEYFSEGMTIFGDKIYQLTWQNNIGFVYNLSDFKQLNTFKYNKSKEGWGLTNDGQNLIKTDGTDQVWFLDPQSQAELKHIEAYTNEQNVPNLNELEFIDGKVYANVYQKNIVLILNPINGAIEGIIDFNDLEKEMRKTQNLVNQDEVLNGIAYDKENNRIFVTGKHWGKLFEIQIIK